MPQDRRVGAIVATAATTVIVIGILFLFFYKLAMVRRRQRNLDSSFRKEETVVTRQEEFRQQGGTLKGIIVDENGLDILYLRKLEQGELTMSKVRINPMEEEKRIDTRGDKQKNTKKIQETELFHEPESNTTVLAEVTKPVPRFPSHKVTKLKPLWSSPPRLWSSPPRPLWSPPSPIGPRRQRRSQVPPPPPSPPPPPPTPPPPPPPPPPPLPMKKIQSPPPPPPNLAMINTNVAPPPEAGCLVTSLKPPPAPRGKTSSNNSRREVPVGESIKGFDEVMMKLKPLHWDKVTANADHSMVWDEINDGSFRFDDDLMEALFGCPATNVKSPERIKISSSNSSNSGPTAKSFILDPRKSQNTAIVLRSLATSRKEILDALHEGQGLNSDILEKLMKISPTQEEASKILQFDSNPTKLADAESFLYQILKAIPSAFIRFDAMLFRSNYDSEILHLKESLQTIELGCKELRTRGIFFKLLEAILKAGNRMNAGTSRGNAQGFNLTTLRKLSFVKSTDGKSTLLHFVVEQVVRSEGKCCVINRNHSLGRRGIQSNNNTDPNSESLTAKEERDREYLMLGLPVLEGLSVEFTNVKKAATIDYDSFVTMSSNLAVRVPEIRQLVMSCGNGESGGFLRVMNGFLEECEEELKVVKEEQTRVMELMKRTTTYYQAGASKDKEAHPLQLFAILKDFLDMVDQVCLDITRKLHKKNVTSVKSSQPPPPSPTPPPSVRFQNLHTYFMSDKPETSSSE